MLRDVWKTFNVSLVMVLPIFWEITNNVFSKREKIKYPFNQLVLEYGLIDTFLLKNGKFDGKLYLLFDKEQFVSNKNVTLSSYFSICELLVDSSYFGSIEIFNDCILVGLNVPDKYHMDIRTILSGSYSTLTSEYKQELYFRKRIERYPSGTNKLAEYIIANDLAYAISIKDIQLRDELKDIIGYDKYIDEYFPSPDINKEDFTPRALTSSLYKSLI